VILKNSRSFATPGMPVSLANWITWHGDCEPLPREKMAFESALALFADAFNSNPKDGKLCSVCIILLSTPNFSIEMDDPAVLGNTVRMLVFPLYTWRKHNLSDHAMLVCILEELCHIFFSESSEENVKSYVVDCIRQALPDVQEADVYNQNYMPDVQNS